MEIFPEQIQIEQSKLLIALPSYASISQLTTSVVISSVERFQKLGSVELQQKPVQFKKIASISSHFVTPVAVISDDLSELESAIDLYQLDDEWAVLMVRGLITHRRRFSKEIISWIQSQSKIKNVYMVAGGNAVYRNHGFNVSDPSDPELRKSFHIPSQNGDLTEDERNDFLSGELSYFVEEFEKQYKENTNSFPTFELLLLLCNEGDNRNDALLCASLIFHFWMQRDIPLQVPKAWECLFGTMTSKFLYI